MSRKSPIHFDGTGDIRRTPIQFVTVCTNDRRPILANDAVHQAVIDAWMQWNEWLVGMYVVMPDHVHFFCAPTVLDPVPLKQAMTFWKGVSTRLMPANIERPVWQKDYWDRVLRSEESYSEKGQYIYDNPVRAGLVDRAEDWKYAGQLNEI